MNSFYEQQRDIRSSYISLSAVTRKNEAKLKKTEKTWKKKITPMKVEISDLNSFAAF